MCGGQFGQPRERYTPIAASIDDFTETRVLVERICGDGAGRPIHSASGVRCAVEDCA